MNGQKNPKQWETESPVKAVLSESQRMWWTALLSDITKGLKHRRKQVTWWNGDQLNDFDFFFFKWEIESPVKAILLESQRLRWTVLLSDITKGPKERRRRKQACWWNGDQLNKLENNNNNRANHQFKCFWRCSYVLFICEFKNKIK